EEMYQATHKYFVDADIVIKAAAVADYRPKLSHEEKLKKTDDNQVFEMERTKDILKSLGDVKENQFLVGFAAETEDPLANGKIKLNKKNLDAIIINDVSKEGAGFGTDTNVVTYLDKNLKEHSLPLASKKVIVDVPASNVNQTFDYYIPEKFKPIVQKGMRVVIPFGPRKITGFIIGFTDESEFKKLREIIDVLDIIPALTDELLELGKWL